MMMKRTQNNSNARRGMTTVEFAVVAPVFFLFTFAAIEFAHLNSLRNTAQNAAYEAVRKVVVPGATADEARDEAEKILQIVGTRSFTITVTPETISSATESVTVEIDIPYSQNALMVPWFTGDVDIESKATLKTERYGSNL